MTFLLGQFGKWLLSWCLGEGISWAEHWAAARKLRDAQTRAATAEATVAQQAIVIKDAEVRHDVETQVDERKDAGTQRVADADPASSAGGLRDDFSHD